MLRARVVASNELVEAIDVKRAEGVPPGPYACEFCGVPVLGSGLFAAARNTPHFALPRGARHADDCAPPAQYPLRFQRRVAGEIDGDTRTGSPVPNVLIPPAPGPDRTPDDPRPARPGRRGGGPGSRRRTHRTTVSTLAAIARSHRLRPDVAGRPLRVPGMPAATYGAIVRAWRGTVGEVDVRGIYYAPLLFRPAFRDAPGPDEIRVRVGSPTRARVVVVDLTEWAVAERQAFEAEVNEARDAAQALYDGDQAHRRDGWLYVLGAPSAPDTLGVAESWAVCAVFV